MTGQISVPNDFDRMGQEEMGLMGCDASSESIGFPLHADSQPMKTLTITAARKRFGSMLKSALREPILITRKNKTGAVIMSTEAYARMTGTNFEGKQVKPSPKKER